MSEVTLAAHEICSVAYPDPVKQKEFLERASKDWLNSDYRVYMWMYHSYRPSHVLLALCHYLCYLIFYRILVFNFFWRGIWPNLRDVDL